LPFNWTFESPRFCKGAKRLVDDVLARVVGVEVRERQRIVELVEDLVFAQVAEVHERLGLFQFVCRVHDVVPEARVVVCDEKGLYLESSAHSVSLYVSIVHGVLDRATVVINTFPYLVWSQ
jgi:hypothetical protein